MIKSTILKRLSFDAKINSLNKIINLRYKDVAKNDEKIKPFFDMLPNNLETVRKFRNKLAHSLLSLTDNFLSKDPKDRIQIKSYDDGKEKYLEIMSTEIEEKLVTTSHVSIALKFLRNHIFSENKIDSEKSKKSL